MDILGSGLIKLQNQKITESTDDKLTQSNFITVIRPVSSLPNVIELSYYSNTVVTCFAIDSIVGKKTYFNTLISQIKLIYQFVYYIFSNCFVC